MVTDDRRIDHDAHEFWDDSTLPYGVMLAGTLATFKTKERADRFIRTAIDSGRHRRVVELIREGNQTIVHNVERRVTVTGGPDRRRLADHMTDDEWARHHEIAAQNVTRTDWDAA